MGSLRKSLALSIATASLIAVAATPAHAAPPDVTASFTYSPANPPTLMPVTFSSTSTVTGNGNAIASQLWDLDGDGTFEGPATPSATRAFARPGSHRVGLRVTDVKGNISDAFQNVRVVNRPPTASIVYAPNPPSAGQSVTFFSTSTDADGSVSRHAWDLDGDGFDDGSRSYATRSFPQAGRYRIRLRVTDDGGAQATADLDVDVAAIGALPITGQGPSATGGPQAQPSLLSPFPIVRLSGIVSSRGIRVRLLSIETPPGARVRIRCKGRRCPFRRRSSTVRSGRRDTVLVKVRQLRGRLLTPGTGLEVMVGSRAAIGKYTRFRIRRARPPLRLDRCLAPGGSKPQRCPGALP